MPIEHHEATIAITPVDDRSSHVTYTVDVAPDSMTDVMSNAYAGALQALKSASNPDRVRRDGPVRGRCPGEGRP